AVSALAHNRTVLSDPSEGGDYGAIAAAQLMREMPRMPAPKEEPKQDSAAELDALRRNLEGNRVLPPPIAHPPIFLGHPDHPTADPAPVPSTRVAEEMGVLGVSRDPLREKMAAAMVDDLGLGRQTLLSETATQLYKGTQEAAPGALTAGVMQSLTQLPATDGVSFTLGTGRVSAAVKAGERLQMPTPPMVIDDPAPERGLVVHHSGEGTVGPVWGAKTGGLPVGHGLPMPPVPAGRFPRALPVWVWARVLPRLDAPELLTVALCSRELAKVPHPRDDGAVPFV
ncbi:hypothetical protein CYMTET_34257, partial [Cymbomonas tetramitiformis]